MKELQLLTKANGNMPRTEEEKKQIWDGFIKKALNRMLTQSKNKITQDMRGQFNGMPFDMLSVCTFFIILIHLLLFF